MDVSDIMSESVVSVAPGTSLHDAVGEMLTHHVGSVIVSDAGLHGIVTRSDVLRAAYHHHDSLSGLRVEDAMTDDVVTTTPSASLERVLNAMEAHNIKKLPVVDDLQVVGIITLTDIARHQPEYVREIRDAIERRDDWTR